MFRYKYKWFLIIIGLALGLLSFGASSTALSPTVGIKTYSYFQFPDSGVWRQRIFGWRVNWTCMDQSGCYLIVSSHGYDDTLHCYYGAIVSLRHEMLLQPHECGVSAG